MKTRFALAALAGLAITASAQGYTLRAVVIDAGGNAWLQSGNRTAGLSFGQQAASGVLDGGQYRATLGFWRQQHATGGIAEEVGQATFPLSFALGQNTPNPFGRRTAIHYALPQESSVTLRVYNSVGRVVATLVSGRQQPGQYTVRWDVNGVPASQLPCGTYFCRLEAGEFTATRKMVKSE
ncbi:T9SS type A sorting domain-containing protein [candidate division WOR-3 bacterium]|nr:T9SS type A sorting domain-containing protein [candidate division WOR-3 bacterium]